MSCFKLRKRKQSYLSSRVQSNQYAKHFISFIRVAKQWETSDHNRCQVQWPIRLLGKLC